VVGLVVAVAGLAAFAVWVRTAEWPIVDPSMFADHRFRSAATAGVLAAFGMGGSLFLLTQDLQQVYEYGPLEAGLRLAPLAVAVLVSSSLVSARVSRWLGQAATIAAGLAVAAAGLLVIALAPGTSGLPALAGLVLVGLGVGTAIPVTAHVLMSTIPPARAASGSGVNGTLQELGSALGVAVLGSVLVARFGAGLPDGLGPGVERSLAAATEAAAGRPDVVRQVHDAFAVAMSASQVVGGLAVLLGGIAAGVLLHRAQRRASAVRPPIEESSRV
jgi:fucose permease